jgi:type IV secretory pathway VirB3-like protein
MSRAAMVAGITLAVLVLLTLLTLLLQHPPVP